MDNDLFVNCLEDNKPDDIFSDDERLVFTLSHTCYCWSEFFPLKDKKIYIYVNAVNYKSGGRITYGQIFDEINKQVKTRYEEIASEYDTDEIEVCNHCFIEIYTKVSDIQYEIWCGS